MPEPPQLAPAFLFSPQPSNPDFRFTCKVPQELCLTHLHSKGMVLEPNPNFLSLDRFNTFLETVEPLRDQIKAFIFEFEYLNKNKMPSLKAFVGAGFQGYAMCIAGERACPPEDCGGTPGFESFLTIIKNPNDEEYESMIEWVGKKYNPAAFNIEKTNRYLKKLKWEHPSIDQLGGILAARDGYKE